MRIVGCVAVLEGKTLAVRLASPRLILSPLPEMTPRCNEDVKAVLASVSF